jgi:hypothetical protein
MERQYFDNMLLAQFYVTKMPVTVYVDGNLLKIVDADDLTDPFVGSGMEASGQMHPFDYRNIEYILIGKNRYSIEDINKAFAAKDEPKPDAKEKPEAEEEAPEEETEPKESIKGKKMSRLTEKLGLAQVSEPYSIQTGDMVHNVNPTCSHFGSKGIVMGSSEEDGVPVIRYAVTNVGPTFKPGDVLSKTIDQLSMMDMGDDDFDMDDEDLELYDDGDEFELDTDFDELDMNDEGDDMSDIDWEEEEEEDDDDAYDDFTPTK